MIDNQFISKCFKFIPKNRIVEGVFKNHSLKEGFIPKFTHKAQTTIAFNHR